jgi:hypothetical protein
MSENAVLVLEIGNERENFERAFPTLEPLWFETSSGADQVLAADARTTGLSRLDGRREALARLLHRKGKAPTPPPRLLFLKLRIK